VDEEFTPGIAGLAMPILGASGFALASLNVAIPVARLDDSLRELCVRALSEAVLAVQKQMQRR
jgi:DNA-binding IclR family transcriptional regulator